MTTFANPVIEALFIQQSLSLEESVTAVVVPATAPVAPRPVQPIIRRSDLLTTDWGWEQLSDYLNEQIRQVTGAAPNVEAFKMKSVCMGFVRRWGPDARVIAEAAFGAYRGFWRSSPIGLSRFTEAQDDYFAKPILEQIRSLG